MIPPSLPRAAEMERCIHAVLADPEWAAADRDEQARRLVEALCAALHRPYGIRIPSVATIHRHVDRRRRNAEIRRAFGGRPADYAALAAAHGLTVRQVRSIVDGPRRLRRMQIVTRL